MKNLKNFNESVKMSPHETDFAINNIVNKRLIVGFSDAIVIYMDEKATTFKKELDTLADKYQWSVIYNDNMAVFIPEDEQDLPSGKKIKKELGLI